MAIKETKGRKATLLLLLLLLLLLQLLLLPAFSEPHDLIMCLTQVSHAVDSSCMSDSDVELWSSDMHTSSSSSSSSSSSNWCLHHTVDIHLQVPLLHIIRRKQSNPPTSHTDLRPPLLWPLNNNITRHHTPTRQVTHSSIQHQPHTPHW